MFYEHDDRIDSAEEAENADGKTAAETEKKRVPRSEVVEKWGHDKFLEREQQPKSHEELVTTYGYDIRNEDNAPRARRRRRYGRGPNKYTRQWEDEDAYEPKTGPRGPNGAAGPKSENNYPSKSRENTTTKSVLNKESDLEEFPPLVEQKKNSKNESKIGPASSKTTTDSNNKSTAPSRGGGGAGSKKSGIE